MERKRTRFPVSRVSIVFLALIVLQLGFPLGQSQGQSTRSSELEKLIEGAKKEGTLKIQWLAGELDGEGGRWPIVASMKK